MKCADWCPIHLPFSDLQSDQYSLSRYDIKLNITLKWPGFHHDSRTIDPIANQRMGDQRGHKTAYFTYRLCRDTMRTPILNWSNKCCLLRRRYCVETCRNGSVPGWNRTRNRPGNLDPLLTLALTTSSLTGTPSLTQISLVNFVSNLDCTFLLICKRQDDIRLFNRQSTWFGV